MPATAWLKTIAAFWRCPLQAGRVALQRAGRDRRAAGIGVRASRMSVPSLAVVERQARARALDGRGEGDGLAVGVDAIDWLPAVLKRPE